MLGHRLITGSALVALLVALLALDQRSDALVASLAGPLFEAWSHPPRGVLLLLFAALLLVPLGALELSRLLAGCGLPERGWLCAAAASVALVASSLAFAGPPPPWAAALLPLALTGITAVALATFASSRTVRTAAGGTAAALLSAAYLGVLPSFLIAIRQDWSAWVLVGVVLTIKASDIGAYFTGRAVGRRKLIPWLSPGKTREGLVGGVAASMVVGGALAATPAASGIPVWLGAIGGGALALSGVFGDLVESLLKRAAGVKDSGRSLPGMGGVLDVIDSLLLSAPVAWALLRLASPPA